SDRDQRTGVVFRERVVAMELEGRVVHTGWLDEPGDAIGVMNVLVLPSYREGFGQVLVEAGALGIPVVATASRGARQAVVDGVTGLLVPPRDPRGVADALLRVAGDPALAARLGSAAIARARDELSQERVVRSVLSVYARVLA
ncbi:MAG TPA: glycosyltransferase, partial [Longimicrobium sp.]|nr:glycosyltransferase [Longimicrobium sp.]